MNRCALYLRVSTAKQSEKGYSLDYQLRKLKEYANRLKFEVVDSFVFEDKKSAKDDDREGYKRMIQMVEEGGHFKTILCLDDDRFMRDAEMLLRELRILKDKYSMKVYFLNFEGIDIYSDQGKLMLTNKAGFSEFFRKQLARKVRDGIEEKMGAGQWYGQAPYGFAVKSKMDGKRKLTYLIENEIEQRNMNRISKLYSDTHDIKHIVEEMNNLGEDDDSYLPRDKRNEKYSRKWTTFKIVHVIKNRKDVSKFVKELEFFEE